MVLALISHTCAIKVTTRMPMKSGLRCMPAKTLCSPWTLREPISLKNVIITNALKMTVKCWLGG